MQIRNRSILCGGLMACLILFGANPAYGQTRARQETRTTTTTDVRRVSTMIGASAQLQSGAKIGTIKDLVISKQSAVEFVVVAFQETFILVPFDLVSVDIERRVVIIDVERERFLRFRKVTSLTELVTLSALLRTSILLQAGSEFGVVDDLVISSTGSIDFVVVAFEERLLAVPFSIARVDFTQKVISLDVTRERLLQAPSFTRDKFPNLAAKSEFSQRVNTFFQGQKGRVGQPAKPGQPTTQPPEKRTPETRPPEKQPKESKPPDKRPPEKKPSDIKSPEKRAPETQPPEKRPVKDKAPENRPPETKPPGEGPAEKDGI